MLKLIMSVGVCQIRTRPDGVAHGLGARERIASRTRTAPPLLALTDVRMFVGLAFAKAISTSAAVDSTHIKIRRSAGCAKRGAFCHAIGCSRGGYTSKIHALTDQAGRPLAFVVTAGNTHDLVGIAEVLGQAPTSRRLVADWAYDANKVLQWLIERGCQPVIPPNPTLKQPRHL